MWIAPISFTTIIPIYQLFIGDRHVSRRSTHGSGKLKIWINTNALYFRSVLEKRLCRIIDNTQDTSHYFMRRVFPYLKFAIDWPNTGKKIDMGVAIFLVMKRQNIVFIAILFERYSLALVDHLVGYLVRMKNLWPDRLRCGGLH